MARSAPSARFVRAQRSNRSHYRSLLPGRRSGSHTPKSMQLQAEAKLSEEAKQILAGARSAFELSVLVGDAPDACSSREGGFQCLWRASASTYGHGTLAMTIQAPFGKKVRLRCHLPPAGLPRAEDSCTVEIGS
jgi:hypothetical protein